MLRRRKPPTMCFMGEELLPGGAVNRVVRDGSVVRRTPGPEHVHRLLRYFEERDWPGAPRFLGEESGQEVLTFLPGHVPWESPLSSSDSLVSVARLVRQCHDLTAGTPWAGDQEVMCHNDLAPKNTVYRDGLAVAFLDWDLAAPGLRVHDVAHMCWQYLELGPGVDVTTAARRMRLMCDAYGAMDLGEVVETVLWWQDRCARGIDTAARAGDSAMARLRDSGAVDAVRAAHDWVLAHRAELRG